MHFAAANVCMSQIKAFKITKSFRINSLIEQGPRLVMRGINCNSDIGNAVDVILVYSISTSAEHLDIRTGHS